MDKGWDEPVTTIEGLTAQYRRAERAHKVKAFALIMPLFLFVIVTFVLPIVLVLTRSVHDESLAESFPEVSTAIRQWDGKDMPPSEVVSALAADILAAKRDKSLGIAAKRLNQIRPGYRALLLKTARGLDRLARADGADALIHDPELLERLRRIDARWGERAYWVAIKQAAPRYTLFFLLKAVDRQYDVNGAIVPVPKQNAIYLKTLWRTIWISSVVTLLCIALGYPLAYVLANLPTKYSNLLMLLLLLPFWTSVLVRTTAWLVLLQNNGIVNNLAVWLGLWDKPLQLVHNRLGVYIAMVHILLPYMVLPLFSLMKKIEHNHMRAAASLGARPLRVFLKVYLPQTLPGLGAGVLLVFILSLGYYITPMLVGGAADQMISFFIAFSVNKTVNWGLAAALSLILMICVGIFLVGFNRLIGLDKMRMGQDHGG